MPSPSPPSTLTRTHAATPTAATTRDTAGVSTLDSIRPGSSTGVIPSRSSHAERVLQNSLSADAARALAALRRPAETPIAAAIAAAGVPIQRRTPSAATTPITWASATAQEDVRVRTCISVPIARMITFPHFMGLFGELARTPEGIVAMYLTAMWLYAQVEPPALGEHVTSVRQIATTKGGNASPGSPPSVSSPPSAPRGGIIGSHFIDGRFSNSPAGVRTATMRAGYFGPAGPPVEMAALADQIIIFLTDDLLTETRGQPKQTTIHQSTRSTSLAMADDGLSSLPVILLLFSLDHSHRRFFRASDRSMFDHYLRGHPDVVTRFCADDEAVAAAANNAKAKRVEQQRKERTDKEEDGERTYNVSLKDSDDDDDSDVDDDDSSSSDALSFLIETNLFSHDHTIQVNPSGGESRFTTRFVSIDHFHTNLLPIKLRQDRAGVWRIYDPYALFHGTNRERPPPIPMPNVETRSTNTSTMTTTPTTPAASHARPSEPASPALASAGVMRSPTPASRSQTPSSMKSLTPRSLATVDQPHYEKPRASIFAMMEQGLSRPQSALSGAATPKLPVSVPGGSAAATNSSVISKGIPMAIALAPALAMTLGNAARTDSPSGNR